MTDETVRVKSTPDKPFPAKALDHCDPPCGLGLLEYDCPLCNASVTDFDSWHGYYAWLNSAAHGWTATCPECGIKILVEPGDGG